MRCQHPLDGRWCSLAGNSAIGGLGIGQSRRLNRRYSQMVGIARPAVV
jgi:hypothetical protein